MSHFRRTSILFFITLLVIGTLLGGYYLHQSIYFFGIISLPLWILAVYDTFQKKHSLLRNFPILGRLRWIFESERSKIQQYFIENDLNGTPFPKEIRSEVYQKSKNDINTTPFGTQHDVHQSGHEYLTHSLFPKSPLLNKKPSVTFGDQNPEVTQPYTGSIMNISAMSFGSLSSAAIKALNLGAKKGGFYHNTGEGGISPHHLQGGDLVFQIGTGYFSCGETINDQRYFSSRIFKINSRLPQVKMIEVKLSQGAKPGHGGILPAKKNTLEISKIRGVNPSTQVASPPYHTAFQGNSGLLKFISKLRILSQGKPVGIKMCVGNIKDIISLIKKMKSSNIYPDFITIDGSEGGTGASPLVYTNNIGTPLQDGLIMVNYLLQYYKLRDKVKLIASGKIATSFDIIRARILGADSVNVARSFMFSLGCIQARECNKDTCPVGIATQNKKLSSGLNVTNKKDRVYNYHHNVVEEVVEILNSINSNWGAVDGNYLYQRQGDGSILSYNELENRIVSQLIKMMKE